MLNTNQSDTKATLIYLKWPHGHPKVSKVAPQRPQSDPKPLRIARSFVRLGSSGLSWTSKIPHTNDYNLFMDPFGPDLRRYDAHYMCHSTSFWNFWCQFLTFQPLSSIIFINICSQMTPRWPNSYIKSLKSVGKTYIFWKRTKMIPKQPSYT